MRQIGHVTEGHFIPGLIHARMKTFPVARELSAFRIEQSPARLTGDGIDLLRVRSAIVIERGVLFMASQAWPAPFPLHQETH